ncbi:MAG: hypothetical protein WBF93_16475 [Pirellulales bacterium]|nr:hypothetical protein [Pirellulales bacterium]
MPEHSSQPTAPEERPDSARAESRFHTYVSSRIPWYVRLIWLLFWIMAIYYVIRYLFPELQTEILTPP